MMNPMMVDLVGADRGHHGNLGEHPIDGVVLEMGEPVSDLEREIVKKARGQECQRRIDGKQSGHENVVAGEENGEDPEATRDMLEVRGVRGPEVSTVEDAVVLDVVPADVPQKRQSPVHRKPVHPVLEEIRVENAGDEPDREDRGQGELKLIESQRGENDEGE
jgi:hypothetical protein